MNVTLAPQRLVYPIDTLSRVVMFGKTGSGKSYAARKMVEGLEGNLPIVIIDPPGVWWGMRLTAAGNARKNPIPIVGGLHGDIPLRSDLGKVYAEWIVKSKASAIFDLSGEDVSGIRTFVHNFLSRLYQLKGRATYPMQLVLEECDEYAPQNPSKEGPASLCLSSVSRICRVGRTRGIRFISITQRPARMHKDVATQGDFFFCGKLTGPQDRGAVSKWLADHGTTEERQAIMKSLPTLGNGDGWWWDTLENSLVRDRCDLIKTFDSMRTPGIGDKSFASVEVGRLDVEGLSAALEKMVEEAKENDPDLLRARIKELERGGGHVECVPNGLTPGQYIANLEQSVGKLQRTAEEGHRWHAAYLHLSGLVGDSLQRLLDRVREGPLGVDVAADPQTGDQYLKGIAERDFDAEPMETRVVRQDVDASRITSDGDLTAGQIKVLETMAWWSTVGVQCPTGTQIAMVAGYTARTISDRLSELSTLGLVARERGAARLTSDGVSKAPAPPMIGSQSALHRTILERLTAGQAAVLRILIRSGPGRDVSALAIAEELGYTPRTVSDRLSELSSLGIIRRKRGFARVQGTLFPNGLPR